MVASHHRGRLFVSRTIQGRLIARVAAYWLIYHVVLWNAIFVFQYVQYRIGLISGTAVYQSVTQLYAEFAQDFSAVALAAVLLAPVMFYDILRHLHRVAGPLLRYENTLRRMMAGETIQPFKLRDGDLLTDFQDVFNQFLVHYNTQQISARGPRAEETAAAASEKSAVMSPEQALILETIGISAATPQGAASTC